VRRHHDLQTCLAADARTTLRRHHAQRGFANTAEAFDKNIEPRTLHDPVRWKPSFHRRRAGSLER